MRLKSFLFALGLVFLSACGPMVPTVYGSLEEAVQALP